MENVHEVNDLEKHFCFALFKICLVTPYQILSIIVQRDATISGLFTERSLYVFWVLSRPSSGVHETVTTASGTSYIIGAVTSFQRDQVGHAGMR